MKKSEKREGHALPMHPASHIRQQDGLLPPHPLSFVHHACCPNFSHLKCTMQFLEAETKGQDAGEASWCKSRGVMEPW